MEFTDQELYIIKSLLKNNNIIDDEIKESKKAIKKRLIFKDSNKVKNNLLKEYIKNLNSIKNKIK